MAAQQFHVLLTEQSTVRRHRKPHVQPACLTLGDGVMHHPMKQAAVRKRLAAEKADGNRRDRIGVSQQLLDRCARDLPAHWRQLSSVERAARSVTVTACEIATRAYVQ